MEWRDTGFVLATRRHGENALIVELLTAEHGRHAGLVRGGQSPRRRAVFQPGNALSVAWRGRLAEHLGTYECELLSAHAAAVLDDPDRLAALNAATTLLLAALPERAPHSDIWRDFGALIEAMTASNPLSRIAGEGGSGRRPETGEGPLPTISPHPPITARWAPPSPALRERGEDAAGLNHWAPIYVAWECALLASLGYGLDLTSCALTGTTDDLAYVSPRTGRAVSREAAAPYRDKLLPLPAFLWRAAPAAPADIVAGLTLTYHFLLHHLLLPQGGRMPEARERLAERMRRHANSGMPIGS